MIFYDLFWRSKKTDVTSNKFYWKTSEKFLILKICRIFSRLFWVIKISRFLLYNFQNVSWENFLKSEIVKNVRKRSPCNYTVTMSVIVNFFLIYYFARSISSNFSRYITVNMIYHREISHAHPLKNNQYINTNLGRILQIK